MLRSTTRVVCRSANAARRWNSQQAPVQQGENQGNVHFRLTPNAHPLGKGKAAQPVWDNPTQNHVWEPEELEAKLKEEAAEPVHHRPQGLWDRVIYGAVQFCYHGFNFITGYSKADPSPRSIEYRLLILESIAGVPGMVAAGVRHFASLRRMQRDGGWIHTLLEEAENERMHLLVFMNVFTPGRLTRAAVIGLQYVLVGILLSIYIVHPKTVHRFVGYLEETAVRTYLTLLGHLEDPKSKVHKEWSETPAPPIAINYWRLPADAKFIDVVKQIAADEMHHRDVNHELASVDQRSFNPHVIKHIFDADKAAEARKQQAKEQQQQQQCGSCAGCSGKMCRAIA